jgi:predicted transcriptional regulator of viral defense system
MRNNKIPRIRTILSLAEQLPYFSFDDLATVEGDRTYLKILLSRYYKSGKVLRIKKGLYVAKEYTDKTKMGGQFSAYLEFISNIIYQPSYLSLEYVLYKHNLLTEVPFNYTLVTRNKTAHFSNDFGNFFYHSIKSGLFYGFTPTKIAGFTISQATKAKALFDYLYLRKGHILNKDSFDALRLNLDELTGADKKEMKGYIEKEGSKKMAGVYKFLFF